MLSDKCVSLINPLAPDQRAHICVRDIRNPWSHDACSEAWGQSTRMRREGRYAGVPSYRTLKRGSVPTAAAARGQIRPMSVMRQICAAASGLCSLGLMSSAIASPPPLAPTTFTHRAHASPAARLDLQLLVEHAPPAIFHGATTTGFAATAFPSAIHHLDIGKADLDTDDRYQQRALGVGETNFR